MSKTTKTFLLFSTTLFLLFTIYWFSPFHIYTPTKFEKISINRYDVLYKSSEKLLDYDAFDEKDVVVLSDQNFGHFVANNRYVMVAFYAPRLYWSKKLVPEYAAAATQLKGSEVVLAKVDALRERRLANKYGVDGYPSLIFFVGGVDLERCYHRDREALVNYTKTKIALGVYTITTTQQAEGVLMAESTVAFLHSIKCQDCKELVAASKMHTDVIFYQSDSPDVAKIFQIDYPEINHSALVLVEKKSQQFNHFDGQFSKSAISEFVSMNKLPLVITFGTENAPSILNSPLKQLWLFDLTHDSKKVKSVFQEVAKAYKGKILFVYAERKRRDVGIGYDHPPRPRKISGVDTEANSGKFIPVKKGVRNNPAIIRPKVSIEKGSGSRFDVLCDEESEMVNVVDKLEATKAVGSDLKKGGLKNRKKGTVVASTSRHVAKLKETRGVPFLDNSSRSNVHSKETGDNEDMDSASVLRHLHKEVHEFIAQPVDPMETVETTNGQKDYAHPVTAVAHLRRARKKIASISYRLRRSAIDVMTKRQERMCDKMARFSEEDDLSIWTHLVLVFSDRGRGWVVMILVFSGGSGG
ncbi:hypothetical protein LWI29_032425 [Acer saccharum]|uniref:Thioredoxin domain-containing protein n=1 Tax=Acer saccharum TaxID=4024 RepID=A0AA39SMT5_ACESA|nr:hypothetical protein LWI29_032425 [Acer saccharum]